MAVTHHLAYVFERFPSFTQTFCVREILELERQGLRPLIFSIRDTRDEQPRNFPDELYDRVLFLPPEKALVEEVKRYKAEGRLPQPAILTLRHWKEKADTSDKARVYEAIWIGLKMREHGLRHAHTHFAGVGARTCWWLGFFWDFTWSMTGHANDLFCRSEFAITLEKLVREASLVVTVSDFTVADLRGRFPSSAGKVQRVYNGLDLEPFRTAGRSREPDRVWAEPLEILSVGRLIEKKGFDDLVRACALLKRDETKAFRCRIVGEGPLESELEALIEEEGVTDRVELVGPRSQREIVEMLSETAVFALPCVTEASGGKDNLPTVLMEAMAARVACASTVLAGVPEMVVDGETGRLCPEREPKTFADLLREMLSDREKTEAMAARGEARAEALFAQAVTARSLRRLLIARGWVRIDGGLLRRDPLCLLAWLRQWVGVRLRILLRRRDPKRMG